MDQLKTQMGLEKLLEKYEPINGNESHKELTEKTEVLYSTILKSIKSEFISTISVDDTTLPKQAFKYVPKNAVKKRVSKENEPIKGATSLKNDFKANIQKKL